MGYKPFDRRLCQECDPPSREAAIKMFGTLGYKVIPGQVEQYRRWDIILARPNETPIALELERRIAWKDGPFPFRTIHMPERKAHSEADLYVFLRKDFAAAGVVPMRLLHDSPKITLAANRLHWSSEEFFDLNVEHPDVLWFVQDQNGEWLPCDRELIVVAATSRKS